MSRLPKLTDRQEALIRSLSGVISSNMPVQEQLLYIAYEIAYKSGSVLNKLDFYAVARELVGKEALKKSKVTHNLLYSYLAYGMNYGISIKNVGELTFPQKYSTWPHLKAKIEDWRLGYQRAINAKSNNAKVTGTKTKCNFDTAMLTRIFQSLEETRASLNNMEQLTADRALAPTPGDVDEEGNYSLIHVHKETVRELHEARKVIAFYEAMDNGVAKKKITVAHKAVSTAINGLSKMIPLLLQATNILLDVMGENPDSDQEDTSDSMTTTFA
jgi:hypothetical protein